MSEQQIQQADCIPGFLCECLIWNVPDKFLTQSTYYESLNDSLIYLYQNLDSNKCDEWGEVSELKYLFRGGQKWTKTQAKDFVAAAWNYVGYK